jgi:hypothetical protein
MATTATEQTRHPAAEGSLRSGSWLMGLAAVGFIGYAVIFLVRNFTDSFLELGIGPNEVSVGKDALQAFSPSLYHYVSHLHIAESTLLCAKCGEAADGWKCAICGSVAREHDPGHLHVGSDRYCTLRCAGCAQADVHCTCV